MVFSSLAFLSVFLPAVFLLYTVIPSIKARNALLIVASLVFYAYGEPIYVLLMVFSSVLNYVCARLTRAGSGTHSKKRRLALVVAIVLNLGILVVFKYTGMLVQTFNTITGMAVPDPQITLPIGISFFTFQALSYVIDVYRGTVAAQRNYFYVLLYISFFPQLIAGPIVKYRDIQDMITDRKQDVGNVARGLRRFICGLAKKVLIANTMGQVADAMFAVSEGDLSAPVAWLGAIAYLFQIYYDFSGYSDMAIGLGLMFGFKFKENFNYPYESRSIKEFWRKWHISLSSWFKDYLYIPLGGNRKGRPRAVLNRLIVFFLCGLWHGASWTFVIWGLWHGFFLLLEEFIPKLRKLPRVLGHIYTMLVVTVGFVVFRADTLPYGLSFLGAMFTGFSPSSASFALALQQVTPWFIAMLVAAVIGCAPIRPLADKIRANLYDAGKPGGVWHVVQVVLYVLALTLLVWCMIRLSSGAYNPFIYFRF